MAGKFTNTRHTNTINSLVEGMKGIIKNPHYLFQNKTPTIVDYYNTNVEQSTLDEASKIQQMPFGNDSPTKYNIINDLLLYGIEQIQVQIENGDFGAEGGEISGEATILPNTIEPYPGDYFIIKYVNDDIIFRVTGVSHDTLDDGVNIYKINYELDSISKKDIIDKNIADSYKLVVNNIGTSMTTIVRSEKFDLAKELDGVASYLREHYVALFYNDRIQSFSYLFNMRRFYDPYMVEFLKNNKILQGVEPYIYINHQLPKTSKFTLDYAKSIYRCFETSDFDNIRRYKRNVIGRYIEPDTTTIFNSRPEEYWYTDLNYILVEGEVHGVLPCFDDDLFMNIENKELFDGEKSIYNIIIKYLNNIDINDDDIENLKFLEYQNNITLFYALPLLIYCIDCMIIKLMVKSENI